MAYWKDVLTRITYEAEQQMDNLRYRLHYALGGPGPIKIVTYRGFGRSDKLYVRGRVLEDQNIPAAQENDNIWENVVNMYKRLESDEVPHARLLARFQDQEQEVVADEEGHFELWFEPGRPLVNHRMWHSVELELIDPIPDTQSRYPIKATCEVLVPPQSAKFVVISDIDDTILRSDAANLLKMARTVFLGNAHTRLPFPGVAALYRALFDGSSGNEMNPLFYVSSSPWNLYDLLAQFFILQEIPIGPVLFLRDWGIHEDEILPIHHRTYKTRMIRQLIDFYQDLPFILIGDSGQEDPEIYAEVASDYADRILAVYIRNVSRNLERPEAINALAEEVIDAGSALVLADDSVAIARHAIEKGYISTRHMPSIHEEKRKDEAPANPIEKMLGSETKAEPPTVKIEGSQETRTKSDVKEGAVGEAVKKAGSEETKEPPTVVVEGKKKTKKRNTKE